MKPTQKTEEKSIMKTWRDIAIDIFGEDNKEDVNGLVDTVQITISKVRSETLEECVEAVMDFGPRLKTKETELLMEIIGSIKALMNK